MDEVLRTLEARLGPLTGEPEPLRDGITNRNFRVRFGETDHVLRLCGADTELLGIDREAEFAAAELAFEVGVGPAVTAFLPDEPALVTAFVDGIGLEPADVREDPGRVARALHAVHEAGRVRAAFSPFRVAEAYRALTVQRGGPLPDAAGPALSAARIIEGALPPFAARLCHNDLLPANLLDDGERLWIIDWEYAGMGDPFFDLGNLSAMNGFGIEEDIELVTAYLGHCEEGHLARVRLHRATAECREGMWGVVQQVLSDLDFDFAAYAEEHLELMLASDWEEWLDGASA